MAFDIEKSISRIHKEKTVKDQIKISNVNPDDEIPYNLQAASIEIRQEIFESVMSSDFRVAILDVDQLDPEEGLFKLIQDAHKHLLNFGRETIEKHLGELPESKKIVAEMEMEMMIGQVMNSFGAPNIDKPGRLVGLDEHPGLIARRDLGRVDTKKLSKKDATYPGMKPEDLENFKKFARSRAVHESQFLEIRDFARGNHMRLFSSPEIVNFFKDPNAKPADTMIWPTHSAHAINMYVAHETLARQFKKAEIEQNEDGQSKTVANTTTFLDQQNVGNQGDSARIGAKTSKKP